MKLNLDSTRRGPSGRPLLRLPRAPSSSSSRAATTPATPTTPPAAPTQPDVFDIMRASKRRLATPAQLEALARKWGRS